MQDLSCIKGAVVLCRAICRGPIPRFKPRSRPRLRFLLHFIKAQTSKGSLFITYTRRLNPISEMETSSRKMWYQEKLMSYWKNQNDCMEKTRGEIMVLAVYTFISFPRMAGNFMRKVEDRTLDSWEELAYLYFKISSSFTSIASLLITLLLLTGFLVKSRFCTGLASIFVPVTLLSIILGYSSSMYLVTPSHLHEGLYWAHCALLSMAAAGALLSVFHTICFLTWLCVREKME